MGGVDAEDLDLAREEGELLERQRQRALLGVRLDIDGDQTDVSWTDLGPGRVQIEFNRKAQQANDD